MENKSSLSKLENEAIHIIREVYASFENPVLLYSIGKDSSVLLHLLKKAFYPGIIPIPLLHIDTSYKFSEMYKMRDEISKSGRFNLIVEGNKNFNDNKNNNTHPSKIGADSCCKILKTNSLLNALTKYNFNAAIGGARRDEEKSRAKERIFSVRHNNGIWDPKNQRPELFNNFNTKLDFNQQMRVFPLSNWTEEDIWQYIEEENIQIVDLYFAKQRDCIIYKNLIMPIEYKDIFDPFNQIDLNEYKIEKINCRYRSLGCIPCTGAIRSKANTVSQIIMELRETNLSERENRLIDHTSDSSMEQKKSEGYF